jgi:4-amino-4-deoxychorismate lyase
MSAAQVVAVLGRGVVRPGTPLLVADDLGLTRGDGCFDACRVVVSDGTVRVDHLDQHLARFARSAAAMELPTPDEAAWRELIDQALAAWTAAGEAVLKLVLTRGPEFGDGGASGLLTITTAPDASRARRGVTAGTFSRGYPSDAFASSPWLLGGVKTLSYAVNVAAKREAARRGVDEVVFTSADGYLLEGPTSGLLVAADDQLWTTPLAGTGVLASVTIGVIMEAARAEGVRTRDALFRPDDLPDTDGAWLVSAIRGVLPVRELDGVPLPTNPDVSAKLAVAAGFEPAS